MRFGFRLVCSTVLAAGIAGMFQVAIAASARAQDPQTPDSQEEETRQIKLSEFTKKRPPATSSGTTPATSGGNSASWNAPTYHRVKPKPRTNSRPVNTSNTTKPNTTNPSTTKPVDTERPLVTGPVEVKEVGVTIWRLRPATKIDTGPGFSVLQEGKLVVMTPERVEGTAPVKLGDRVRISIESPRTGYLYVINREQYADGKVGNPALIFPTTRVRGGDNNVVAGRLIDIPDSNDAQPFFTLTSHQKPGEPQILGELLTVVITERPLKDITPARGPIPLDPAEVAKWEKEWAGDVVELLEMNGGAGKTWTAQEKQAGEATRSLTQEDPTPQTIYRVTGRPKEPVMLTVQLLYGTPAPVTGVAAAAPQL